MFRVWMKLVKDTHLLKDTVVEIDDPDETRTHKVYKALEEGCHRLDLAIPIWLELNKKDFIRHAKTRFTADSFIETIDFDYLEFHVIEEDLFY
ncbi:MAG: hypothetical protein IJM27_09035 [Eubacterium sp.]|nr:hypothetical protein [Eubacterium sp.]